MKLLSSLLAEFVLLSVLLVGCKHDKSNPVDNTNTSQKETLVWENIGLSDLRVNDILIINDSQLFAATELQGLQQTTDGGTTWASTPMTLPVSVIIRNSAGHLFTGREWGVGVYRSIDNGAHWDVMNNGLTNKDVRDLVFDNNGVLYAATGGGIFKSSDNAVTWTLTALGGPSMYELAINAQNHIFGGGYHCFKRSTDGGNTWTDLNTGSSESFGAMAIDADGHVFAASVTGGVIVRSTDKGEHWTRIDNQSTPSYITVFLSRSASELLGGSLYGIFRSTDDGATWSDADSGLTNRSIYCLSSSGGKVYAGSNKGLFRTK